MAIRIESQAEPIPGFRLIERLGCGGFGEVWKAEVPGGLHKAIKIVYGDLNALDASGGARAEQERKSLDRIKAVRHPYILALDGVYIIEGQLLIVMELADCSLWDRYRECRTKGLSGIPHRELLRYMHETAEALDLMNEKFNLQHLDIKPQNLFLQHNHIKVADFGLVKALEGLQASVTGGVTPVYAAPETFEGTVTRFSDQYSLAIVYQELLTAIRPFSGTNTRQLILQHIQGKPNLDPLPPAERPVIERALAKIPTERYPRCQDFVDALQRASGTPHHFALPELQETPVDSTRTPLTPRTPLEPEAGSESDSNIIPTQIGSPAVAMGGAAHDAVAASGPQTVLRGSAPETAIPDAPPREEQTGNGVLTPTLVLGLGRYGRNVLKQLREEIENRHGPVVDLPHLRLVTIDTDPEVIHNSRGEDVVLARLGRPSRYLRPRDLPPINDWLDTQMLYRIPRDYVTMGIRTFGRLAFIDNFRTILGRLRRDLDAIVDPEALAQSMERTGLDMRTNCPRVYVVTHLAGGTGSGMFLDLAYLVRDVLRQMGFQRQELISLCMLPPANDPNWTDLAVANTYAALVELRHYMTSNKVFSARWEDRASRIEDQNPPFSRCLLVPEAEGQGEACRQAGDWLYRQLLTSLGMSGQEGEPTLPRDESSAGGLQTFGLRVISSPHRPLLRLAAQMVCQELIGRWTARNTPEAELAGRTEIEEFIKSLQLDPDGVLEYLKQACHKDLGETVADKVRLWVDTAGHTLPNGNPDPAALRDVLQQMYTLLGRPEEGHVLRPAPLVSLTRTLSEQLCREAAPRLIEEVLRFLDAPGYRFPGTEAVLRQASTILEEWLKKYEQRIDQATVSMRGYQEKLAAELAEWDRAKASGKPRKPSNALEGLGPLITLRFEQILMQGLVSLYVGVRGALSDQVKDLRFARGRLTETLRHADAAQAELVNRTDRAGADMLLPAGCESLKDAARQVLAGLGAEELAQLEAAVQPAVQRQFPPLGKLCLQPGEWPQQLFAVLVQECENWLESRVPRLDVAELFLQHHAGSQAVALLGNCYDQALPILAAQPINCSRQTATLLVPDSESGRQLASAAQSRIRELQVAQAPHSQEIVLYREFIGLALEDLAHLGSEARQAYELSCKIEHFTPHARVDISWSA